MAAPTEWRGIVVLQVITILLMRLMIDRYFKEPVVSAALHPAGLSFLFLTSLYAVWQKSVGAGFYWKKRLYGQEPAESETQLETVDRHNP